MTKPKLHFWYEFASPYACLAAFQIEDTAKAAGVEVVWHPFLLGAIFKMMKMPALPMQGCPQKVAYMWMDAVRQAKHYGVAFKKPSQFPRVAVLPARVALVGRDQGWCPEFSKEVFKANFVEDQDIGRVEVIAGILERMGLDPLALIEKAQTPENKLVLRDETQEAYDKGIFGVPTFFVGEEIFWGNERLDQALKLAVTRV